MSAKDATMTKALVDTYEADIARAEEAGRRRAASGSGPAGSLLRGDPRYHYQHVGDATPEVVARMTAKGYVQCAADEDVTKGGYQAPATAYWRKPLVVHQRDIAQRDAKIMEARHRLGLPRV